MNEIFSLFGKEIKNNIIIIFTFCDSFKDIKGINALKDRYGIFYEVLGDIEQLPYFGFNNWAYFTNEKEFALKFYENNKNSFKNLIKYIVSLKSVSLESTRKVINLRMFIKNNICQLYDITREINILTEAAARNKIRLTDLQNESNKYKENEVRKISYIVQEPYEEVMVKEINIDSGRFVLYCNKCNKICLEKYKENKECLNYLEFGNSDLKNFGSECTECHCNNEKHNCKQKYIIEEKITGTKNVVKWKDDPDSVQSERAKKIFKEKINKQLEEVNTTILEINKAIHLSLKKGFDILYQLASQNIELNILALKTEKYKFGYIKEKLNEKLENKTTDHIIDMFIGSLDDIENIYKNEDNKQQTINKFQSKLVKFQINIIYNK